MLSHQSKSAAEGSPYHHGDASSVRSDGSQTAETNRKCLRLGWENSKQWLFPASQFLRCVRWDYICLCSDCSRATSCCGSLALLWIPLLAQVKDSSGFVWWWNKFMSGQIVFESETRWRCQVCTIQHVLHASDSQAPDRTNTDLRIWEFKSELQPNRLKMRGDAQSWLLL